MLWIVAAFFACLSVLLTVAWPLAVAGPRRVGEALNQPAAKSLMAAAATLAIGAILTPLTIAALHSGADTVQFVATEFGNLSFGM